MKIVNKIVRGINDNRLRAGARSNFIYGTWSYTSGLKAYDKNTNRSKRKAMNCFSSAYDYFSKASDDIDNPNKSDAYAGMALSKSHIAQLEGSGPINGDVIDCLELIGANVFPVEYDGESKIKINPWNITNGVELRAIKLREPIHGLLKKYENGSHIITRLNSVHYFAENRAQAVLDSQRESVYLVNGEPVSKGKLLLNEIEKLLTMTEN